MSETIKRGIAGVFASLEDRRQASGYYKRLTIPAIPRGNESPEGYPAKKGDQIISNGNGPIKKGIVLELAERYQENGYWYYRCVNGAVLRQKDIEKRK